MNEIMVQNPTIMLLKGMDPQTLYVGLNRWIMPYLIATAGSAPCRELIRECGSTLYVGLPQTAPPISVNFFFPVLLTLILKRSSVNSYKNYINGYIFMDIRAFYTEMLFLS